MASKTYVIVLDKELGFCRLFRDDSIDIPPGEILATVQGLRRGYDAMMRLNRERRPITFYHLCGKLRQNGQYSYRIAKTVSDGWQSLETHIDYSVAKARRRELAEERREETRLIMKRTGITTQKIPKFTDADLRYIAWLKETGRLIEQVA